MHARIRADEDMPSHFWVMATARAESIVPLPQRHKVLKQTWNITASTEEKKTSMLQSGLENGLRQSPWE